MHRHFQYWCRPLGACLLAVLLAALILGACGGQPSGAASQESGTWTEVGSLTLGRLMIGDVIPYQQLATGRIRFVVTMKPANLQPLAGDIAYTGPSPMPRGVSIMAEKRSGQTRQWRFTHLKSQVVAELSPGRWAFLVEQAAPFAGAQVTVYEQR
jgi:hypothetical protein